MGGKNIVFVLVFGLFALPAGLQAQSGSLSKTPTDTLRASLEPVVISVSRLTTLDAQSPFSLSNITRSESNRLSETATGTESLLSRIPGVFVSNRDNYSLGERLSIRGSGWRSSFGVRGVQVLVDGLPLTSPDGQTILELVDPNLVRNVQVIRGPSALFWGNGSGGTIYFSTKSMPDDPSVSIRSSLGSFGLKQNDIVIRTSINSDQVTFALSDFRTDGYREYSKAHIIRSSLNYKSKITKASTLSYIGLGVIAPDINNPGSLNQSQLDDDPSQANAQFITQNAGKSYSHLVHGLKFEYASDRSRFESVLFNTFRSLENPISPFIIGIERVALGNRNSFQLNFADVKYSISADWAYQRDHRKNWENQQGEKGDKGVDQIEEVSSSGIAAIIDYKFDAWRLFTGIRADILYFKAQDKLQSDFDASGDRWMSALTPQLGITYSFADQTIFGGLTSSFESPTTTELSNRPDLSRGFNQNLDPEKSVGLEIGMRGYLQKFRLTYDVAVYNLQVINRLNSFQTTEGGDRTFFENSGISEHSGFESSFQIQVSDNTQLNATYTHSNFTFGKNDQNEDKFLPGVARNVMNAALIQNILGISSRVEFKFQDKMFANNANTVYSDGYFVMNLNLSHSGIKLRSKSDISFKPYVSFRNITNETYVSSVSINAFGNRYFEPAMPRNFLVGISVSF